MTSPRNGRPYRRLRAEIRAASAAAGAPCWLCGDPIDYTLKAPHRMSWSLDHRIPVWNGGSDTDPDNFASSHFGCNAARGAREGNRLRRRTISTWPPIAPRDTSWRWPK